MLTLEQLMERLESLYVAVGTMYKNQAAIADELYDCKIEVTQADALLKSTRAAAVAAKEIQQKEHGSNQALRDAHEREYLAVQHLTLENAQLREQQARHNFDQVQREISGLSKSISLSQTQARLLDITMANEVLKGSPLERPEEG